MLDVKRLGHLVMLADECHFARAAQRVHLSQPAFSRSIQAIERDVGLRLFDRETGEVKPTPAGMFLIERARRLLFDARSLQRDVALYRDSQLGDTAFGVGPFPAATFVLQAMPRLRQKYPQVGLRVEISNWQQLLDRLHTEDIEFFVSDIRDLPADERTRIASLGGQRGHFFVRAGHPLAGKTCRLPEVWSFGVAATKLPRPVKAALAAMLGLPPGQAISLALECDDVALLRTVAMSTDTAIASTDAGVFQEVQSGMLVPLDVEGLPALRSEMGIVTLANRSPSPMALRAMDCISEAAAMVNEMPDSKAP